MATEENASESAALQASIHQWGSKIFARMEAVKEPAIWSRSGFYRALMTWAMEDEAFKIQLFRFVDVLPSLQSAGAISEHLREYLIKPELNLSPALRLALRAAARVPWLLGTGVRTQVTGMARRFMLGHDEKRIIAILRQRNDARIAFTVDILGETVLSETEADQYSARYLPMLELLARATALWPPADPTGGGQTVAAPRLNLSIKISALCSQHNSADPAGALERISRRLRPILRRAKDLGALINFDMEQYALKGLTLRLFKSIFAEPEFAREPACGLAMQAYLRESEADLRDILAWAQGRERSLTIRLVKGAYWDYETIIAQQKGWPIPVWTRKADTDANFERLSLILLKNQATVEPAFGTHNVRSIAHALAQAERLGVPSRRYEFQMLYGMADPLKSALVQLGFRVREYCPIGELIPGMAYLVRRLLENTSNEGFLAQNDLHKASHEELLRNPLVPLISLLSAASENVAPSSNIPSVRTARTRPGGVPAMEPPKSEGNSTRIERHAVSTRSELAPNSFRNQPPADFTLPAERERVAAALRTVRDQLGQRHPLIINNKPVQTHAWTLSLNPADQSEVIGSAAQAGTGEANAALDAAKAARARWARTPVTERAALLKRLAQVLRREKPALTALEILEAGKNWIEADADVTEAIDFCNFYAESMLELDRPELTQDVPGELNVQQWWPRGVGVIIAPWNFPLAILTGMATAAIVAGNTVVLKPSDQTPVLAAWLMTLLMEAGLPAGVANLVTGSGAEIGSYLVAHSATDFIAFTGSKEAGMKIWETGGRTGPHQAGLKKVICEMGGKNALIVDSDADLDEAVTGIVTSAFGYQGQKCSALSRLIVLSEHYERLVTRVIEAAASLPIGPPEHPGNLFGPVISRTAQQRILKEIELARTEATLRWQGPLPAQPGACFVPPTVFTDVPSSCRLFREEVFGPVLAVSKAKDFTEALVLANDSEFALTGGLYSRSPANIERAKAELVCGNLYLNRAITGAVVGRQPFGGFKMSGGGTKAGGREYLLNFLVPRVVTENRLRRGFAPAN